MKTSILIYSTDISFRTLFADSLAQYLPFRSIISLSRPSRPPGDLPGGEAPNLIFVDLSKANLYSKILVAKFNKSYPEAELVVLVAEENPEQFFELIQVGASAYLVKDGWRSALPSFLAQLEEQKVTISPKVARYLVEQFKYRELHKP